MQIIRLLMAFALARTSSCNACDQLKASPVNQVSALEPPPQRHLSEPSIYRTDSLSRRLSNSLHITHHYCCYSFTICLPHYKVSSKRVTTFFCLIYCYIQSCPQLRNKWMKKPHTCTSDQNELIGKCFPVITTRNRRACYITICPWMDTESRLRFTK